MHYVANVFQIVNKLLTYIASTDGILSGERDNPTIGLLICKTKDNVLAQYATSAINVPVGISKYERQPNLQNALYYFSHLREKIK